MSEAADQSGLKATLIAHTSKSAMAETFSEIRDKFNIASAVWCNDDRMLLFNSNFGPGRDC